MRYRSRKRPWVVLEAMHYNRLGEKECAKIHEWLEHTGYGGLMCGGGAAITLDEDIDSDAPFGCWIIKNGDGSLRTLQNSDFRKTYVRVK